MGGKVDDEQMNRLRRRARAAVFGGELYAAALLQGLDAMC